MSRVSVFCSAAGGVGKTTLALYSSKYLAKSKKVLLVDFTLHGSFESIIRVSKRKNGIGYLSNKFMKANNETVDCIVFNEQLKCDVLLNTDAIQMEKLDYKFVDFLINEFIEYDHIIFDTSFELSERNARLFQIADDINLVTIQDITVFWRTMKFTEILDKLMVDRYKLKVILNKYTKQIAINIKEFESEINIEFQCQIPSLKNEFINSHNSGDLVDNRKFLKGIKKIWEEQ